MTNAEKYKTATERREAYYDYAEDCCKKDIAVKEEFGWLELDACDVCLALPDGHFEKVETK